MYMFCYCTFQCVQKKDPSYQTFKEDTVWSMDALNDYINTNVASKKQVNADWVYNTLTVSGFISI